MGLTLTSEFSQGVGSGFASEATGVGTLGGFSDSPGTPAAPVNVVAPVVSGIPEVGQTLSATNGTWTGVPAPTYTYQWKRGVSDIVGATSQTYVQQVADVGLSITCVVTATNASGSVPQASNAVTTLAAFALSGSPATTGTTGGAYSFTPTSSGGQVPYGPYSLTGSIGASGLSFNTTTGALTSASLGPAATYGPYTISGVDSYGVSASLAPFSITVSAVSANFLTDQSANPFVDSGGNNFVAS